MARARVRRTRAGAEHARGVREWREINLTLGPMGWQAGSLSFVPHKGKPCLLLLGRRDHRWRLPHRLTAGDVFGVGRSLLRVLFVGTLDASNQVTFRAAYPQSCTRRHGCV